MASRSPVFSSNARPPNDASHHDALCGVQLIDLGGGQRRGRKAVQRRRTDDTVEKLESQVHRELAIGQRSSELVVAHPCAL